jgi:hypothetical protein
MRQLSIHYGTGEFSLYNSLVKLTMELYLDVGLANLMMIDAFLAWKKGGFDFSNFFTTFDDFICSIMTISWFLVGAALPLSSMYYLRKYYKQGVIKHKGKTKYQTIMMEEIKTDNLQALYFNVYFLLRRIITIIVLIALDNYPFF